MFRKILYFVGLVTAVLLLTACAPALTGGGDAGMVIFSFSPGGMLTSRTIAPPLDMEPYSYDLIGTGPGGMRFSAADITTGSHVQPSLTPGDWSFSVSAFNDDDPPVRIGAGSAAGLIKAGKVTTIFIDVLPLPDAGRLELAVTWPQDVLLNPELQGSLTPLDGTPTPLSFTIAGDQLSGAYASPDFVEAEALPSGYYTVSLELSTDAPDGSGPVKAWGTVEAVRIVAGEVSSKVYDLVEDVNHGGVVINPDMQNPVTTAINGVVDPLEVGTTMTVTAEPTGADSYQWYLDGVLMTDGGGVPLDTEAITFGDDVALGYHRLSLIVAEDSVIGSTETGFQVVQGASGSSLWGRMVWGYDVWQ